MNRAKARLLTRMGLRLLARRQARRLANYAAYRLSVGRTARRGPDRQTFQPPNVVVAVTARCNLQCDFCYFTGELNAADADRLELDHETFLDLIAHPAVRRGLRIALTGGEPLLNADLFKMTATARARGFIVSVVTNGLRLAERRDELLAAPPDVLAVSYHPEARDRVEKTLQALAGRIPVKLNFVLSRSRLPHLGDLLDFAVAIDACMVDIEHLHPSVGLPVQPGDVLTANDPELREARSRIQRTFGRKMAVAWGPARDPNAAATAPRCRAFWHSLHVDALGRVSPCCQWPLSTYGESLFTDPEAWNSPAMLEARSRMRCGDAPSQCVNCPLIHEDYLGI